MSRATKKNPFAQMELREPMTVADMKAYLRSGLSTGANWVERLAFDIERRIPHNCQHPSAVEALRHTALAREAETRFEASQCFMHAVAHAKDFHLYDDSLRGETSLKGTSKGGNAGAVSKQEESKEWQEKILPSVERMLKAGKTNASIAAWLVRDTDTKKRPSPRGIRTVSDFVAKVRKHMAEK